jgi:hypothetical protein
MKTKLTVNYRLRVHDAATRRIKREIRGHNTVLDSGLTELANGIGTADCFKNLCVGSSAAANYIPGGVITFTQALTTITASAPFFTAPMVGGIFKFGHGTGGLEAYIQSIGGGGTTAVVDISRSVVVPDAGTVWQVQQTHLTTFSFNYDAYVSGATNCFSLGAYAGGVATMTHQRTYIINTKGSPYTINELGWGNATIANPAVNGRVVLGAPEVIGTSDYVVITLQMIFTLAPPTPQVSAAGDQVWNQHKGTGTFNGTFALETWSNLQQVASSGATTSNHPCYDSGTSFCVVAITAAGFTQNAHVGATSPTPTLLYAIIAGAWAQVGGQYPGTSTLVLNGTITAAGQTLYGVGVNGAVTNTTIFDMAPNWSGGAPTALPAGAWPIQTTWSQVWTRPLSNP